MKIRVSATRMELLKLRKRLALAQRGHRLLKDKQDELVRQFFIRQVEYRELLTDVLAALGKSHRSYTILKGSFPAPVLDLNCHSLSAAPPLTLDKDRILNLTVPTFAWGNIEPVPTYGLLEGAGQMENVLEDHLKMIPLLIKKAEKERALFDLLKEIGSTRRRVNALEHKLIPMLQETILSISSKLSEIELSALTRLMRVKEIISQEEAISGGNAQAGS